MPSPTSFSAHGISAFLIVKKISFPELNHSAQASKAEGDLTKALSLWQRSLAINPKQAAVYNQLGHVYTQQERWQEALHAYGSSVGIAPNQANTLYNIGNTQWRLGRSNAALEAYSRALQINPGHAAAWHNAGSVLEAAGSMAEAERHFVQALKLQPTAPELHSRLGKHFLLVNRLERALESLQNAERLRPNDPANALLVGTVLFKQGRLLEAVERLENALQLAPGSAAIWTQLGVVQNGLARRPAAKASFLRALALNANQVEALNNLGNLLKNEGALDEAVDAFDKAIRLEPNLAATCLQRLHQLAHLCDWERMGPDLDFFDKRASEGSPFAWLALRDDPAWLLAQAQRHAAHKAKGIEPEPWDKPALANERIHVGYFSADFHDHATMHLMARHFELHDRHRFCVHAFAYGPPKDDGHRARLRASVEHFHDISALGDFEACQLARAQRLDIAVDLKGHTGQSRSHLFARRLAPVQIAYLGYPGTTGEAQMDYLIADAVVVPPGAEQHFTESVVRLPHCYQVNDDQRAISPVPVTRADENLPAKGFVFCCFNASYKISATEFGIWMGLLNAVEGSVLWLLACHPRAVANLHQAARHHGVDPARLVFATRRPLAEHLARHRLADLFLDTFVCNAHTTASDALWAGLPLLTLQGQNFAARVASSLLAALDLSELITHSPETYAQRALWFAHNPTELANLRARLATHRTTHPLFNSGQTVRHIEAAFEIAQQRHREGLRPTGFNVPPLPEPLAQHHPN